MISDIEYAQLANRVYFRMPESRTPVPEKFGWSELIWSKDDPISGFSYGAYQKENDIVISFTGSNENLYKDFGIANFPAGIGLSTAQITQAAVATLEIMRAHPGANISFTGHSLGGGLASVMAILFNKDATTFDPAPFESSARNPLVLVSLQSYLALNGYSNDAFDEYAQVWDTSFPEREMRVRYHYIDGEFLQYFRSETTTIGSALAPHTVGDQTLVDGISAGGRISLHSMTLLAAMLTSTPFKETIPKISLLLELIFDELIYSKDPQISREANFLDKLYVAQVSNPDTPLLDNFAADLNRLISNEGANNQPSLQKALIVAAMDYYYLNDASTAVGLFKTSGGGIHFYNEDIPGNSGKSLPMLAEALAELDDKSSHFIRSYAQDVTGWHIQNGTDALNWTASSSDNQAAVGGVGSDFETGGDGHDLLLGLGGADTLRGNAGADLLIGSDGADQLDGGEGSDYLYGGAGSDTYTFSGNYANDWINDSDGQGSIVVNGATLSGAQKLGSAPGSYKDMATGWIYAKAGNDLVIYNESESQNRITIRDWSEQKSLGITLSESVQSDPSSHTFIGDFKKKIDSDGRLLLDEFGNYQSDGSEQGAPDMIKGSAENDALIGLDGDDALFGKGGDDYIDGGSGVDVLMGGLGADSIFGGSGIDIVYGSSTGATFSLSRVPYMMKQKLGQGFIWTLYTPLDEERDADGLYNRKLSTLDRDEQWDDEGNYIEAGSGEDAVYAGTNSDIVYGGDDSDDIYGMAGSDLLYGEAGGDRIFGDAPDDQIKGWHITYTPSDTHSNDILSGGAGNDTLLGQGADDEVYGDEGDDLVYGDDRNLSSTPIEVHGNDYLDGGDGKDTLCGGGGNDSLYGGQDDDQMYGDDPGTPGPYQGKDYLDGENGDDYLVGNGSDDSLFGGQGHDSLFGDGQDDPAFHGADYLDGEDGNDELTGGGGSDELFGGSGNDYLYGDSSYVGQQFHGNDYLDGEAGNDTLVGQGGDDVLEGGADDDILVGDGDADDGHIGNDRLSGGSGDDYLFGGGGNDTLYGGEGDDTLDGGEGVNVLNGGAGTDVYNISFENGALTTVTDTDGTNYVTFDDAVAGAVLLDLSASTENAIVMTHGDGAVKIATGAWNGEAAGQLVQIGTGGASQYVQASQVRDHVGWVMRGTTTADAIDGSLHGDRLSGGDGNDALQGSQGDDQLVGGDGADLLDGGDDKDTIVGGSGNDNLLGGKGQDGLTGDAGNDTLEGGQDDDVLIGGDGDDAYVIRAGDGNDKLLDTGGNDQLVFGTGLVFNDVTFEQEAGTANVTMRFASGQDVTLFNGLEGSFETIKFGDGSTYTYQDLINQAIANGRLSQVATYGDDFMQGGAGPDVLSALAGNDTLAGGVGADRLLGGTGQDIYLFKPGGGVDTIEDGEGGDTIRFGAGIALSDIDCHEEPIDGTKYLVISYGASDAVRVRGGIVGSGISTVVFSDQTSITYGDFLGQTIAAGSQTGTAIANALYAGATDDVLLGLGGNDSLFGGHGNDTLRGGAGADELHGGAGDDELNGGANNDSLEGGAGADRYELTLEVGHDVIVDTQGSSVLVAAAGIVTANLRFRREGADLTIYLDGTTDRSATVKGFYDQPDLWSWQQGSGGKVSLKSLVQANATAMASQTEASLVAAETGYFKASLTQNWLDKTFNGSPYARGSDGVYRWSGADGAGGNMRTQAYTVSSATMFSDEAIADFDTTTDDAFSSTTESIGTRTWTEKVIRHVPQGPLLEWPPGFSLKWVKISPDFVSNDAGEQPKEGYWTLNGRPVLNLEIPWVKVERPDLLVEETMTYTQDAYHWTETGSLVWNDLRGGDGNNKITWFGSAASVDAGAGDDYVNGTEQAYDAAFGEVYGGGVEDREHASVGVLLYGNDGNDTLLGTMDDDELIGGAGEDKLDGYAGADTYRVYGASTGVDVIFDSGALIYRPYEWDGPTGAPRTIGGRNDYDLTQDVLRQASGMLSFPGTYEGNVPLANDIAGMEWLFNEGVIGKDSVVFDHGITQSDLTVTRGNITLQGITRETLDISWGTGRGIRVVMPNAQDAVGMGIERFVFSDGQVLDARQMAALGQPVGLNPDLQPGQSLTDFDSTGENTVSTAASLTLTNGFENLVLTGSGNANGKGNAADNVLKGNAGINHLDGEAGADTMYGGAGDDLYEVDNAADVVIEFFDEGTDTIRTTISRTLEANVEHGIATGVAAIDLRGNHLDNQLLGNDASNLLNGGAGNDTLSGKGGNDTYHVDSNRDVIVETADGGTDRVISTAQGYALSDHTEDLKLTEEAILGRGNAMANVIHGNVRSNYLLGGNGNDQLIDGEGDDVLDGGAGMDVMSGGQGNDVYVVDSDADTVIEAAEEGVDVVISSASVTLVDNAETLLLTGGQAISGNGNSADNLIAGNSASNELNGGAGNDTLHGTADVLLSTAYLADIRDAVNQHLFGIGGSAPAPSGNASSIHGVDTLRGGEGDDTYYVEDAQDVLIEQAEEGFDTVNSSVSLTLSAHIEQLVLTGSDDIDGLSGTFSNAIHMSGNVGNNRLVGASGADTLDGGAGIDTQEGGLGNDLYYIDNTGDILIELADGGIEDQAYISTSYTTTSDHVEFYQLTGSDNLSLTAGSGAGFHLWGNEGSNLITGGDGNDDLYGNFGGIDTLKGGKGDDIYYLTSATDLVMENTDEGFEEVSVLFNNYILTDNVEVLRLLGAVSTGTGNADSNGLFGNGASNKLYGMGGDDLIQSYGGHDTLEGGKGDDLLAGGAGNDTYVYNPDDGYDYISNQDATGNDTLLIHGATESQIWLRVTGEDMNISVIGRDGEVTVANWTQGTSYQIDNIKLDNGKTLSAGNVANLVNAMAGLAPPPAGQTTLPGNYQASLNSTIAANWA